MNQAITTNSKQPISNPTPKSLPLTPIPPSEHITRTKIREVIKQQSIKQLNQLFKNQQYLSGPYQHSPRDLLRWTNNYVQHLNQEDKKGLQETVNIINKGIPSQIQSTLTSEIMNNVNFINTLIKKGFFRYLIAKYKPFIPIKPDNFIRNFHNDIKWYKEYLARIVYRMYQNWLSDYNYYDYFIARGCVDILSSQTEWRQIHELFMESIYDCQPRINRAIATSPLLFEMKNEFSCQRQGHIPFENTINAMRQFTETYDTKVAINLVNEGIFNTMDRQVHAYQRYLIDQGQIQISRGIDSDNRLACLIYCVFKLEKFIIKSIQYIQAMYQQSARRNIFLTQDHMMEVIFAANRYLLFRNYDGRGQVEIPFNINIYPQDNRIKLFNFKSFASAFQNPFQWRQFKSKENYWAPVFSVKPIESGNSLKIEIKGKQNQICIGICSDKSYESNNRTFERNSEAVFFNVHKKSIFNCTTNTKINIDEDIRTVQMKILDNAIEWCLNDTTEFSVSLDKLDGMQKYAFTSLFRGAQFQVIDF